MDVLESKDSEYTWSTTTAKGSQLSTTLPKIVRTFEDYAKVDFAIGDNDPVYFAVVKAAETWGTNWATKFCVGMLTYYHMGTAVKAADLDGEKFWQYLASQFKTAPRGAARRHFRGVGGEQTLASMMAFAPNPINFFTQFPQTYAGVRSVCENRLWGFGPYFHLKIADYMDRCLFLPIHSYDGLGKNLSKVPGKAATILSPGVSETEAFYQACHRLHQLNLLAPPTYDRPVGPAEVETILCDWLHARDGTNWLGADLIVKRQALQGSGEKGVWMADWLPPVVKQGMFKLELV